MPADIRSFFGGTQGSQSAAPTKKAAPEPPSKGRSKRKVISDDEEEEDLPIRKATPKKPAPKRAQKQESPKGVETSTSDYFSSKSKSERASDAKKSATKGPSPETPKKAASKAGSTAGSARPTRTSARKSHPKAYKEVEEDEDDVDVKMIDDDADSGDDIHIDEFKSRGRKRDDDYEEDDEEVEVAAPSRQTKSVNPRVANGKKRKSADTAEDGEDKQPAKAAKTTPKKPRAKKPDEPEDEAIQGIFDSIQQVRPPTPPPRDKDKKFDFRANAQRSQAAGLAPGSKDIPEGAENCLAGLTFVFTGVLESLGRDEGAALVKRYGGKVSMSPSGKTSFVVLGQDAGPKKLETIREKKLKTINEDGLFDLIRKLPANGGSGKAAVKAEEKQAAEEAKAKQLAEDMAREEAKTAKEQKKASAAAVESGRPEAKGRSPDDDLWTVKYAPTSLGQVCGNKTQVEKLQKWLRDWHKNAKRKFKVGGPDGSGLYRAVILSGGPGIGKTTSAHLVARLEGYDIVETNASDTRSKKLVEQGLRGVLDTTSLMGYFSGTGKNVDTDRKKLVLIMDEVDGMSAGDRGGVGALASVCRKTNIPIILICNERSLPKMKPFDGCTYGLPFRKPTVDQVRGRIMTILYREGIKDLIPPNVINALIEGTNVDIRQIINMLSTVKLDQQSMAFDDGKKMANAWEKNIILKPWDITHKILSGGMFAGSSKATLNDKIELYFNDHEFSPLMLQENYLGTNPSLASSYSGKERNLKELELASKAAESISDGDLVDRMIHGNQQQWSLMPTHAVFSFVRPASFVAGGGRGQTRFTSYLGNLSKTGKLARFVKEIQGHMRLRASADRHDIRQQYVPVLWQRLVKGLELHGSEPNGIEDIIELMDSYFLTKEDWDAIGELGVGISSPEHVSLSTQVRSNFTRKYNAASHPLPFMKAGSSAPPAKKAKDKPDLEEALEESDDEEVLADPAVDDGDESEELDLKKDKYVQAPKKKRAAPKKAAAKKGKNAKDDDDDLDHDDDEEEDVKPRGRGRPKGKGAAKGKGKK